MNVLHHAFSAFWEAISSGVAVLGNPTMWVAIAAGAIVGVIVGALPGVGTTLGYALILPFTYQLDITTTIVLLMSLSVGSQYGNSIPAILVGVPGSPAAALTVIDGYAMHKQGDTGFALGIAFVGAVFGQLVSILFFIAAIIPLAGLAYYFLQPELFSLYVFGLVAIVSLTGRNVLKGLLAVAIGLLIAVIGLDPVNATSGCLRSVSCCARSVRTSSGTPVGDTSRRSSPTGVDSFRCFPPCWAGRWSARSWAASLARAPRPRR
jgi:putative tricarboxylic transport membrane protein